MGYHSFDCTVLTYTASQKKIKLRGCARTTIDSDRLVRRDNQVYWHITFANGNLTRG